MAIHTGEPYPYGTYEAEEKNLPQPPEAISF